MANAEGWDAAADTQKYQQFYKNHENSASSIDIF
jgi:hypothetical protein